MYRCHVCRIFIYTYICIYTYIYIYIHIGVMSAEIADGLFLEHAEVGVGVGQSVGTLVTLPGHR